MAVWYRQTTSAGSCCLSLTDSRKQQSVRRILHSQQRRHAPHVGRAFKSACISAFSAHMKAHNPPACPHTHIPRIPSTHTNESHRSDYKNTGAIEPEPTDNDSTNRACKVCPHATHTQLCNNNDPHLLVLIPVHRAPSREHPLARCCFTSCSASM